MMRSVYIHFKLKLHTQNLQNKIIKQICGKTKVKNKTKCNDQEEEEEVVV